MNASDYTLSIGSCVEGGRAQSGRSDNASVNREYRDNWVRSRRMFRRVQVPLLPLMS